MRRRAPAALALALAIAALTPAPAPAFSLTGLVNKAGSLGCSALPSSLGEHLCNAGVKLAGGHLGGALHVITGGGGTAGRALGLAAIVAWVLGGAHFALHETAHVISASTTPQLTTAWFSSTYKHVAEIATLLTLPFLFAAAVQALIRSDLPMLARAGFGYLPLAMLAVGIATPLTVLLLKVSDQASAFIARAAGNDATSFLTTAGGILGSLSLVVRSPFVAFLVGFFMAVGALVLWVELLVREVAVYVIVLMLPLVFAAFVWPARRMWAIRAVEILVALILAKFVIVAVLALGAGALHHSVGSGSLVTLIGGVAVVTIAAFSPWALVKVIPLGELATAAAGPLRGELRGGWRAGLGPAVPAAYAGSDWAGALVAGMRREAMAADPESAPSPTGFSGVTLGEDSDSYLGQAGTPGGQASDAPDGPSAAEEPDAPAAPGSTAPGGLADDGRGPAPPFPGFEGAEDEWQHRREWPTLILGPEGVPPLPPAPEPPPPAPPPPEGGPAPDAPTPPPAEHDDPLPPAQPPEDGPL